jgi:hypothetical protein
MNNILNDFNDLQSNLKFTVENEDNNKLNYQYLTITNHSELLKYISETYL